MTTPLAIPGVCLPAHRGAGDGRRLSFFLQDVAETALGLGFQTAWTWDHILPAPAFYANSWHHPFTTLAAISGSDLQLGTGILIAPTRNPVLAATAISSLQSLSGQPMLLGIGTGWYKKEFEVAGMERRHRGALTDEFLDVVDLMFAGGGTYRGRFLSFEDVDPGDLGAPPEVWIAGGSQLQHSGSFERPVMAKAVARRILRYKRWLTRPSATPQNVADDLELLAEWAARNETTADGIEIAHLNVLYMVETDDPERARKEQLERFYKVMSTSRGMDYFEQCYLVGTIAEIRERVQAWSASRLKHLVLYPLDDPVEQLRLYREHLGDLFAFPDDSSQSAEAREVGGR